MNRQLLKTRGAWGVAVGALLAATSFGASAIAASGGGGCQLDGSATFAPNGPGTANTFGYSFGGALSGCQSSVSGAPTSGAIGAGQVVTESVPLTVTNPDGTTTTTQGTARYQEPLATGSSNVPGASCASGTTSGTAVTAWNDGTVDVIGYTTQSAGAGVQLQGTVVPSVTLALVPGSQSIAGSSAPSTYTISTTSTVFPVGNGAQGLLTFQVADPSQCTTASGVTDAAISGVVGVGSTS
jgi:hypothetical protein